ncbi:hypothetical protein [Corynebacterium camporealensis]|uniref:hypothetical protein n=1 Tax=Corynebacterium camporealensis TaxID=161896 RepID=UPI002A910CC8|nr:hypothetical protein [Corynebacterium camporealensis]
MIFAKTRFLLMGIVLALMSILIVMISGLTAGLINDGVSGLKAMNAQGIAFEEGTKTDSALPVLSLMNPRSTKLLTPRAWLRPPVWA